MQYWGSPSQIYRAPLPVPSQFSVEKMIKKPNIPDNRIKKILTMLLEDCKWDDIETKAAYSRGMISRVKCWFQNISIAEAFQYFNDDATMLKLRSTPADIAKAKQLCDFISKFSLPTPFIRQATEIVRFFERTPDFPGYGEMYGLIYRGQFLLPDLNEYLAWPKHPLFGQTKKLLGNSIAGLEVFIKDFVAMLESCRSLLRQIYSDSVSAVPGVVKLDDAGNNFVPIVYSDAIVFGLGGRLDPPNPRYYKCEPFGTLFQVNIPGRATIASFGDKDGEITLCYQIRDAHIRLREKYRTSKQVGDLVKLMYGVETHREILQQDFKIVVETLQSISV